MSPKKISCCYKCTDRWVSNGSTCHSTCTRYKKEKEENDRINELIRKDKELNDYHK